MQSKKLTPLAEYRLRLDRGESILDVITSFCNEKEITHAEFTAIGAIKDAEVGAYILESKTYTKKQYPGIWEVCSCLGNVALVDGEPFIHAHVVLSNQDNETVGGHLFSGKVGVTLEVHMHTYEERVSRSLNKDIGLKLLEFKDPL